MTPRQQIALILVTAVAAFVLYGAVRGCGVDDEARIRQAVNAAALGVERRDTARAGRVISALYADANGLTKATLLGTLENILRDFKPVSARVKQLRVEVKEGGRAEAVIGFQCIFEGVSDKKMYQEAGKFVASFAREDGVWRIRSLEYQDADSILFAHQVA